MDSDKVEDKTDGDSPRPAKTSKITMLPSVGVPDAKIVARWLLPWIIAKLENDDAPDPTRNSNK